MLGLMLGIGGNMFLGNRNTIKPVYTAALQSPADLKNNSVAVEAHFQSRMDSLMQNNITLGQKVGNTKSLLQKAKQDNKVLLELVDTLIAHAGNIADTGARLAQCDSINATVQDLIVSGNIKDSLYEDLTGALQAQVNNKDSVIGTQQQQYTCLRLSFDKSLAQQDVLFTQNLLVEKQLKKMKVKNKLLSAGIFVLTGIGAATIVAMHH